MTTDIKNVFMRWLTGLLLLLIVGGGARMVYPNYKRSLELKKQSVELQERIEAKKREILILKENQRRFTSDADFVETIARQNRRVFPGELVFVFEEN